MCIMRRVVFLCVLALFSAEASAETDWKGTGHSSVVRGSGDVMAAAGTTVTVSGATTGEAGFVGAVTSLDAAAFKGREVRLAGTLAVAEGKGDAGLWLRADGPDGRVAFALTAHRSPVRKGDTPQEREIWLYIPSAATSLKFGATLSSAGRIDVQNLTLVAQAPASTEVSAHDLAAYVLPILRANALNADKVDWPAQEAALLTPEMKQLPAMEAYAKLRGVLAALEDHHSFLQVPRQVAITRTSAVASQPIETRVLEDVGYVLVPGLRGSGADASAAFSTELCQQIAALAPKATRGWIVDLRRDTGGNMWPMLKGLHALLGNAEFGGLRGREGTSTPWRSLSSDACGGDLSQQRVAVLVGPKTASSGEAVAVAFRGRPGTRFFGQPTAGLATSNRTYHLPDGGGLQLTTALMVDRKGEVYPKGITPEVRVPDGQDAIAEAVQWLRSAP